MITKYLCKVKGDQLKLNEYQKNPDEVTEKSGSSKNSAVS